MKNKEYLILIVGIIIGIITGMLIMHFLYVYSFERLLTASNGIIQNMQININETKFADRIMELYNITK